MKHVDDWQRDGFVTKKYKYASNTWVIINNNNQVENAGDRWCVDDHDVGGHCNGDNDNGDGNADNDDGLAWKWR